MKEIVRTGLDTEIVLHKKNLYLTCEASYNWSDSINARYTDLSFKASAKIEIMSKTRLTLEPTPKAVPA